MSRPTATTTTTTSTATTTAATTSGDSRTPYAISIPELHKLLQSHMQLISTAALRDMAQSPAANEPRPITTGLGEYLILASHFWADLTQQMLASPAIKESMTKIHEDSRRRSHLADLSGVVNMDMELTKLNAIRDLTRRYSTAVQEVWGIESSQQLASGSQDVASAVAHEIDIIVQRHLQLNHMDQS